VTVFKVTVAPEHAQKLRDSKVVKGYHRVPIGVYWIEMMIADIVRSAREIRNHALLDELDSLFSALDCALASGRRVHLR
jgi:hypothetical protein